MVAQSRKIGTGILAIFLNASSQRIEGVVFEFVMPSTSLRCDDEFYRRPLQAVAQQGMVTGSHDFVTMPW